MQAFIMKTPLALVTGFCLLAAAGAHQQVLPATPGYLTVEIEKLRATLTRRPKRSEVPVTCEEQLVVEYYAR